MTETLFPLFAELAIFATLLPLASLLTCLMLRKKAAVVRSRIWTLTLLGLLLFPLAGRSFPRAFSERTPEKAQDTKLVATNELTSTLTNVVAQTESIPESFLPIQENTVTENFVAAAPVTTTPKTPWDFKTPLLTVWLFGILILGCSIVRSLFAARKFVKRDTTPCTDPRWLQVCETITGKLRIRKTPPLLIGETISVPLVTGILRPVVLIPNDKNLDPKSVLMHELSHVKRRDTSWQLVSRIVCAIYWFHPFAWLVARQIRVEREHACDDMVLLHGSEPGAYARLLLEIATKIPAGNPRPALSVNMARKHQLEERIDAILDPEKKRSPLSRRMSWATFIVLLAIVLICAMFSPFAPLRMTLVAETQETQTPETPAPEYRLNGMLVTTRDVNGEALGDVEIRVLLPDFKDENRSKTTDSEGKMFLALPESPRELFISAVRDGYVSQLVHWERKDMQSGHPLPKSLNFVLRKGTTLGGIVVDENDKPVSDATVKVVCRRNGYGMPGHLTPADSHILSYGQGMTSLFGGTACKTDADGRWTLNNVPEGKCYPIEIIIDHDDFISNDELDRMLAMQNDQMLQSLRAGTYRFVMKKGAIVEGTVTDAQERPITGAVVVPGGDQTYYHSDRFLAVTTDAQGKYRLRGLRFRKGTVTVIAEGFAPEMKTVQPGENAAPLDFLLQPGKTLMFQFVDQKGKAIPDVQVNIGSNPDSWWREGANLFNNARMGGGAIKTPIPVFADASGLYRWDGAPEDAVRFSFHKVGYLMEMEPSRTYAAQEKPYRITLHKSMVFTGRVVDADTKEPLSNFKLMYGEKAPPEIEEDRYFWQTSQGQSFHEEGKFRYVPIFKLENYFLCFEAEGYENQIVGPYRLDEEVPPMEIFMKKASKNTAIFGQVLLPSDEKGKSGVPAKGVQVVYKAHVTPPKLNPMYWKDDPEIFTDDVGRFILPKSKLAYGKVYFLHEAGFAAVDSDQLEKQTTIQLQKYGTLEIRMNYDDSPDALNQIRVNSDVTEKKRTSISRLEYERTVPEDGVISFERFAPGKYVIMPMAVKYFENTGKKTIYNTGYYRFSIKPGETKRLDLRQGSLWNPVDPEVMFKLHEENQKSQ